LQACENESDKSKHNGSSQVRIMQACRPVQSNPTNVEETFRFASSNTEQASRKHRDAAIIKEQRKRAGSHHASLQACAIESVKSKHNGSSQVHIMQACRPVQSNPKNVEETIRFASSNKQAFELKGATVTVVAKRAASER
jgi:hypothetical protein